MKLIKFMLCDISVVGRIETLDERFSVCNSFIIRNAIIKKTSLEINNFFITSSVCIHKENTLSQRIKNGVK